MSAQLRYDIKVDVLRGKAIVNQTLILVCAFAAWTISLPTMAFAAGSKPFGISREALPSALNCTPVYPDTAMDATGQYVCHSLPGGSGYFEQYILAFVAGLGICNVTAVTPYREDDARGTLTRSTFSKLTSEMTALYGPPDQRVDHASTPTSATDDLFTTSIIAEDRQVFDQWNDLSKAGSDLESASLAVSGSQDLGLAVFSVVRFAGNDACLTRLEAATGDDAGDN